MFNKRDFTQVNRKQSESPLSLRFEQLEERRMLSGTQADIVFLLDESASGGGGQSARPWLAALVSGDVNMDGDNTDAGDTLSLSQQLSAAGIDDVRYGLVGFADNTSSISRSYAQSQLFDFTTGDPDSLFGDPSSATQSGVDDPFVDTDDLNAIFDTNLAAIGGDEDGWDAIEHAISEYEVRDGAVVVFVLAQNDEGRISLNDALTRPGVLAALQSKNATLDVLVPGIATAREPSGFPLGHNFLYTVDGAGTNELILGVEADEVDGTVDDLLGDYRFDSVLHTTANGQFDDTVSTLDTINGETTPQNAFGGETENAYVRLAWDTGGSAWDLGIVEKFSAEIDSSTSLPYEFRSPEANALRDAFVESLADQILRADASGWVFHTDEVLLSLNLGSTSSIDAEGDAGIFYADDGTYTADGGESTVDSHTATQAVDIGTTQSIPEGTTLDLEDIFQSARGEAGNDGINENISFTIDKLHVGGMPTTLEDGGYVVELFFVETDILANHDSTRTFEVMLEGQTMLEEYQMVDDYARVVTNDNDELNTDRSRISSQLASPLVKRFYVDVTGGNGLQIDLIREFSSSFEHDPLLSAVRILQTEFAPPTVTDVVLSGSDASWIRDPFSMSERVAVGEQLLALPTTGIDTIAIHFSEEVVISGNELELRQTESLSPAKPENHTLTSSDYTYLGYNSTTHVATWKFNSTFANGKYAIHLADTIIDQGGNRLDGEWANPTNGTPDYVFDDVLDGAYQPIFESGNGEPGSEDSDGDNVAEFRFHFSILAGDYNGNNQLDGIDYLLWQQASAAADGDGDGDVDGDDLDIWDDSFGAVLPLWDAVSGTKSRDLNDNEILDYTDVVNLLSLWDGAFGTEIGDPGYVAVVDIDGGGVVNGFDYLLLQTFVGFKTSWYMPTTEVGGLYALVGPSAPQVTNVIVSGSNSQHADFSFDTVDGSGSQLATVPVGGADTISIAFSEDVNVSGNSLLVIGMTTVNKPTLAEFTYDTITNTATWRYESWSLGDNYLLSLSDSVTDVDGNLLDGEWTNPASITTTNAAVSEFPSGDSNPGGRFNFFVTLLAGDANLDGVVDGSDYSIMSYNWSVPTGMLFQDADFNGDGTVNGSDFTLYATNYGTNLQDLWVLADLDGDDDIDNDDLDEIRDNLGMTSATWADGDLDGDGVVTLDDLDLAFLQYGLGFDVVA